MRRAVDIAAKMWGKRMPAPVPVESPREVSVEIPKSAHPEQEVPQGQQNRKRL